MPLLLLYNSIKKMKIFKSIIPIILMLLITTSGCKRTVVNSPKSGCDSISLGLLKPTHQDSIRLASCLTLSGCDSISLGIIKLTKSDSIRLSSCIGFTPSGQWTWVSGSQSTTFNGIYGTLGLASLLNVPGGRAFQNSWNDKNGNLFLFGGYGFPSSGNLSNLNDLWKWDGTNWTWMNGSKFGGQGFVYGTAGIVDPTNIFGAGRNFPNWTDANGNNWMYGGSLQQNLWKWDGTNWTYFSNSNGPDGRQASATWADNSGNFWLFGGNNGAMANDLWKWNGTSWANILKPNNNIGVYGTKGVAASTNTPGGRWYSLTWKDKSGNLWLFGGVGVDAYNNYYINGAPLNDLWKWDGTNWTWVSGSNTANPNGVYGTQGIASASNIPGGRYASVSWLDISGNLWLFGGQGINEAGTLGNLNDLWKWDGTNWTWVSGSKIVNASAVYGTQGISAPQNIPSARSLHVSWIDKSGNFWLFGGSGGNLYGVADAYNDLWKYQPNK